MKWLPNALTISRILMACLGGFLEANGSFTIAFALVVAAASSDGLDGWLARKMHAVSDLGQWLDNQSDRIMLFVTIFGLTWQGGRPDLVRNLTIQALCLIAAIFLDRTRTVGPQSWRGTAGALQITYYFAGTFVICWLYGINAFPEYSGTLALIGLGLAAAIIPLKKHRADSRLAGHA